MVNFSPFLLHARSPPSTLDVNRATRAVSRSGNRPEAPPYSPARRAIVHSSHESRHALARFRGTFISFLHLVSSRSRPCSHHQFHSKPTSPSQSPSYCIVPRRTAPASPIPSRSRPCAHHTHTHTLSLSFSLPLLRPRVPLWDRDPPWITQPELALQCHPGHQENWKLLRVRSGNIIQCENPTK